MNQMIEALQGIVNQNQGETLDVPHPTEIKDVRVNPLNADWHFSVTKADSYKDEDGERHYNCVSARVCEILHLDEYGEPLGEPKLVLQHKYGIPTRQSRDISVTAIKPAAIRGMKERFPGAFEEAQRKLVRDGRDLPLVFLDNVPPDVISMIMTMGVRTIREFAEFDEAKVETLLSKLHQHKMAARANFVQNYLDRAREAVAEHIPAPAARRTKQAA